MFTYAAALVFLVFCTRVVLDPRRFSNAVLLGITVALVSVSAFARPPLPPSSLRTAALAACALLVAGALALAFFLMANGVKMVRREGGRPGNLLTLLTGLAILGFLSLLGTAVAGRSTTLVRVAAFSAPPVGYVSFLFLCFLGYALLYGRLPRRRNVDFVVVLGCGLVGGSRVGRLLANRLDRARRLYEAQAARGNPPLLVTSGGQGSDEDLPEADAMAAHLVAAGVPEDRILREDRSRTTEENLLLSKKIMQELKPDYRCVVVTNNFHVFRAALTARRTGVRGQVVGAATARYFWPGATIREFVAVFLHYPKINLGLCLVLGLLGLVAFR
ncbi:YdcF family protein [Streptomyces sp. NPDC127079]|uniref:YdcF family protein n=1 Tax=Streptomyces sp. NPDC127079 TaxID=3347132 RepID=UPI00364E5B9D